MVFQASFVHIVQAKLGQADAGDNEAKLMTKLAPEWVRTSDPVIRSPARYHWTTAPALGQVGRQPVEAILAVQNFCQQILKICKKKYMYCIALLVEF